MRPADLGETRLHRSPDGAAGEYEAFLVGVLGVLVALVGVTWILG